VFKPRARFSFGSRDDASASPTVVRTFAHADSHGVFLNRSHRALRRSRFACFSHCASIGRFFFVSLVVAVDRWDCKNRYLELTIFSTQGKSNRRSKPARAVNEITQVAANGGITAFLALAGISVVATVGATKRIESRLQEAIGVATSKGVDLTDLYYDFDVPGDAYPFGDAEGLDFLPKDWKPPKKGDPKYLPSRMLGMVQVRNSLSDLLQECERKNIDVSDVCVPFEDYEGPYDTNQKRMMELRKRLGK